MNPPDFNTFISDMKARRIGNRWMATCPCHDDRVPSLSIREGDDGWPWITCHGKCEREVVKAELRRQGIWPQSNANGKTHRTAIAARNGNGRTVSTSKPAKRDQSEPVTLFATADAAIESYRLGTPDVVWDYTDAGGQIVGRIARWNRPDEKIIRPVSRIGDGWACKAMPEPRPLFNLPKLAAADTVYIVEGERCCDIADECGIGTATTSAGGSSSPQCSDWSSLSGKTCIIIPDCDKAGEGYANQVAKILAELTPPAIVKIVRLPGLSAGDDIEQFRHTRTPRDVREELAELIERTPFYNPPRPYGNIELVNAADVESEPIDWLWPGRIARGKLTVIAGHPGLGKSLTTMDLAARVTSGSPWPDNPSVRAPIGGVVIINGEDGVSDTIRPRLEAAGANICMVNIVTGITMHDEDSGESFAGWFDIQNIKALEDAINQTRDCLLCVIDPVSAFLPSKTDSHNNSDVRALLRPISEMAERLGVAVVCISHLTKNSGGNAAVTRVMGSLAFTAAARAVWAVTRDPEDEQGPRRLFLPVKNNVGPDCGGLAFSLTTDGGRLTTPRLDWERGAVNVSADDALAFQAKRDAPERDEAKDYLREMLASGPRLVSELQNDSRKAGLVWITVKRAKDELGIVATRHGYGKEGGWKWSLPVSAIEDHIEDHYDPIHK